jgi:ferredoxin
MAKKYRVTHDKESCIGCGACAAMAPDHWTMNDDGKANLIGSTGKGSKTFKIITEHDLAANEEAASSCPVEVIHIEDEETKKKIV